MPLYEYKCDSCGEAFEVMQKFADEPLKVHENCGGAVRRLLSSPMLQFKGSGWYVTDYAKGGNGSRKGDKESKPSDTKSEGKPAESKSTESKPAASDKAKSE
jgi:putative FmdB family regulatory protein